MRLKVLDKGEWSTLLLPKASFCNDASHGWYTEWPRMREVGPNEDGSARWLLDMHGMFFDFPRALSAADRSGLTPIGSHLRYVPDFCDWDGRLVLATDETSIQDNELAGQPQSNLWFGDYEDLKTWGPVSGYGGPWLDDDVKAGAPSDPFLIAGFDRRVLHLVNGPLHPTPRTRAADQQPITSLPDRLKALPLVTIPRGDWRQPAAGFRFEVTQPATVYLAVDARGDATPGDGWAVTDMALRWGDDHNDRVFRRDFLAGPVAVPGNDAEHTPGSFGMPHAAFVETAGEVAADGQVRVQPSRGEAGTGDVTFTVEVDTTGRGDWTRAGDATRPPGESAWLFPSQSPDARWLRVTADRDCVATAYLHQTEADFRDPAAGAELFAPLADISEEAPGGLLYPAKMSRDLRMIVGDRFARLTKARFDFEEDEPDAALASLLEIEPHAALDERSVVVKAGGRTLRLPTGDAAFDSPTNAAAYRQVREVESERLLANLHGTFYELPLIENGEPPDWRRMRPVSSHTKAITDFCSWNGLLVLTGVRADAPADGENGGRVFRDREAAVWCGGVDELWAFGKPRGRGYVWKDTPVEAGEASDPFLMTGYDRKRLTLSHAGGDPLTVTVQADIDGRGGWIDYRHLTVPPGGPLTHDFPDAFSAHWVRCLAADAATVTAELVYE